MQILQSLFKVLAESYTRYEHLSKELEVTHELFISQEHV